MPGEFKAAKPGLHSSALIALPSSGWAAAKIAQASRLHRVWFPLAEEGTPGVQPGRPCYVGAASGGTHSTAPVTSRIHRDPAIAPPGWAR